MEHVLVLLVMLAGVTHAVFPAAETNCNATQNTSACSVALGGSVYIQLMANASGHQLRCKKELPSGSTNVFSLKKDKVVIQEAWRNRTEFFISNGTFKLSNVEKADSGQYTVEVFHPNGVLLETKHVKLDVQENTFPIVIPVSVVGLLLIVMAVTCCICINRRCRKRYPALRCVETSCDGRQDTTQCYGALGGTVGIQLITEATNLTFDWLKNQTFKILSVRNNIVRVNKLKNRSSLTLSNGTFRISNLSYTDSAEYSLKIFNLDGRETENRELNMSIQAPVSTPQLDDECLPQGEVKVSCSSEAGDSHQYSWTLDGQTLPDTVLRFPDSTTNTITLRPGLTGQLDCLVKNNINNATASKNISICKGFTWDNCTLSNGTRVERVVREVDAQCPNLTTAATTTQETSSEATTTGKETGTTESAVRSSTHIISSNHTSAVKPTDQPWYIRHILPIAGSLSVMVVLLVVVVGVRCVLMKKKKKEGTRKEQESEDAQDVTYADVRIMQRQAKPRQEKAHMEVEYGQVKVSGRRRQPAEPTEDDCVYAKVVKR
ncbi:uncharacterized protein LOC144542412 [Centroberyx gerrardi]